MSQADAERNLNRLALEAKAHTFEIGWWASQVRENKWWRTWQTERGLERFESFGVWCKEMFGACGQTIGRWIKASDTLVRFQIQRGTPAYMMAVSRGHLIVTQHGKHAESREGLLALLEENASLRDVERRYNPRCDEREGTVLETTAYFVVRRVLDNGELRYVNHDRVDRITAQTRETARRFPTRGDANAAAVRHANLRPQIISIETTQRLIESLEPEEPEDEDAGESES